MAGSSMSLYGKAALVTGGAQGIGRAVVQKLLQNGAKVALVDLNRSVGEDCKRDLESQFGDESCVFIQCDVTDGEKLRDAFKNTVETFGRLDVVINNAGINNEKNWEKTIDVNLTSVVKGTYLALEQMSKEYGKEGGVIINVSSMAAFHHSPHQPVYTATKYGVIGFSRAIADASEQGDYRVRINTLCPAFVDTQLLKSVEEEETMGKFVKYKDDFKDRMDKYGILKPSLIADGMLRLITDESLNGAVMKITCSKGIHFHTYEPLYAHINPSTINTSCKGNTMFLFEWHLYLAFFREFFVFVENKTNNITENGDFPLRESELKKLLFALKSSFNICITLCLLSHTAS
ncbi:hypothetical protein DNTS_031305, partial [Danionella cerebrum]